MNDLGSSPTMKALLEAARRDGPAAASRAKIWTGVSGTVGTGAAAVGVGGATFGLAKMVATGTLFGGAMTVGVAAALLYVANAKAPEMTPDRAHVAQAHMTTAVPVLPEADNVLPPIAEPQAAEVVASLRPVTPAVPEETPSPTPRPKAHAAPVANAAQAYDSIGREASLVAKAQAALVRGDGAGALRIIDLTRSLPSRQLEPEELAVRAQALRALGKTREAAATDAKLKSSYPLSALVRSR
jgi:hypothetical protein